MGVTHSNRRDYCKYLMGRVFVSPGVENVDV
jgi:hypothetical protein